MVVHPDNLSHQLQLGLDEYGFNAGALCTVQDLKVCYKVLPSVAKFRMECMRVKVLQLFDMPAVQSPSLESMQERGQDYSFVDFQLRRKANVMLIEYFSMQPP